MSDMITIRLDAELKAAITQIARQEQKSVGELVRELVRERIRTRQRRAFEAQAERDSLAVSEAADAPDSDDAQVLRELEAYWDEFGKEWS